MVDVNVCNGIGLVNVILGSAINEVRVGYIDDLQLTIADEMVAKRWGR